MNRQSDPLAVQASTWDSLEPGPACNVCNVKIERGHRYYHEEASEGVVHYSCLADLEARLAVQLSILDPERGVEPSPSPAEPVPSQWLLTWESEIPGQCDLCVTQISTGGLYYLLDRPDPDVGLEPVYGCKACVEEGDEEGEVETCRIDPVSLPVQPAVATERETLMTTETTTAPTATAAPAPDAPKKNKTPPAMVAERNLAKHVKLLEDAGSKNMALLDGLRGAQRLLQTLDQIANPAAPPAAGTAWAAVVELGKSQRLLEDALSGVAASDLF